MAGYLLDSTVLIDRMRDRAAVTERLGEISAGGGTLATCAVTIAELYSNLRPSEEAKARRLFGQAPYRDIPRAAAEAAGLLRNTLARQGRALSAPDALIAGLALALEATLLTKNVRDFARIPDLVVEEIPRG